MIETVSLPAPLAPLAAERRWLVWRWETTEKGKPTKVPYRAAAPDRKASSTDPTSWSDYETAVRAVAAGKADGIGFAHYGSGFAAFDIDDCRDRETQEIAAWAMRLIERAGSYAEVTVSGTGVRIIGVADGEYVHRNQAVPDADEGRIETYRGASRSIVVTGESLDEPPAALIDETAAWLDEAKRIEREAKRAGAEEEWRRTKGERSSANGSSRIYDNPDDLPRDLDELVRFGPPAGEDRSATFHHAVCWLKDLGWSVGRIETLLSAHPRGVAEKYEGRLRQEIERSYDKADPPRQKNRDRERNRDQGQRRERDEPREIPLHWHRDVSEIAERAWLVRDIVPEVGKGLLAGQWGSAKTFLALDMSAAVMTGEPFAGRRVLRRGGALFIAPEVAFEIPIRLKGPCPCSR